MTEQNYYRLHIANVGEWYEWGNTAREAIATARQELTDSNTGHGAIIARPAVYKEWIYSANAYTNGGQFLGRDING